MPATGNVSSAVPIVDVARHRLVGEHELVDALVHARFRLLGELHDDPAHHVIRARLVRAIAARGVRPAVVFEQFDFEHDRALVQAQARGADTESIADAGHLDRKGWQWPMHAPIMAAALDARLPIRAGNLSRETIDAITSATGPRDDASGARWMLRFRDARWSEAQERDLSEDIVQGHCNMLPARVVPRLVQGERVRDAAMAQALVDDATADGAILIAGDGHVRANLGVPVYLHAPGLPGADSTSISVGFVESGEPAFEDTREIDQLVADHPGFDYLVVTPQIERPDPCAEFRARGASTPAR